jgi:hypothetical protein
MKSENQARGNMTRTVITKHFVHGNPQTCIADSFILRVKKAKLRKVPICPCSSNREQKI